MENVRCEELQIELSTIVKAKNNMANVNVGPASGTVTGVSSTTTTTTGTTNSTVTWAPTISSSHHPQHPHLQHQHHHSTHPHAHPHTQSHHIHGHHAHPHMHIDQDAEIDIIMAKIEQASFLLNRSFTDTSSPPIMPFFIPSQDNRVLAELENSRTSAAALTSKLILLKFL